MAVIHNVDFNASGTAADLVWSTKDLKDEERGRLFLAEMAEFIPVYSPLVRQIYGDYDLNFVQESVVVIPKIMGHLETYSHINGAAVRKTSTQLVPGDRGVEMIIPTKNKTYKAPLVTGLRFMERSIGAEILPVIQKGDLKQYKRDRPALHLHAIDVRRLDLSEFQKNDLARMIRARFSQLVRKSPAIRV